MSWKKTLLICIGILAIAAAILFLIFSTEPTATREGATKESAMLVEGINVNRDTHIPRIIATGTVMPEKDILLRPRVSGEIIGLSPAFTPGGTVRKGQVLLQIDSADYKYALEMTKTDLKQVKANLEIELGRQDVARRDYQLFNDTLTPENEALVLRKPQLNSAKSQVEAARVAVQQAELELERTTIRAPFDAHILTRNVNVGSQVSPGDNLGRLVGLDAYWVEATIPISRIEWLSFSNGDNSGSSKVTIRNNTAWQPGQSRTGYVDQLVGAVEDQTRMARVLITVRDPLALHPDNRGKPMLMIGAFVEVEIEANEIKNVIRLSRDYLRKNDKVWVMKNGELDIREVQVLFRDAEYAYISTGLEENEFVVTTNLSTVVEGSPLRRESNMSSQDSSSNLDSENALHKTSADTNQ